MAAVRDTRERSAVDFQEEASAVGKTVRSDHAVVGDDQANIRPNTVPCYVVPVAFCQQTTMVAAWNSWYGSQKEVSAIAERLLKVRSPALASIHSVLKRSRFPGTILLQLLGIPEYWLATRNAIPDEFSKIDVSSRLDTNLSQLLGQVERNRIKALCSSGPATDVIDEVVSAWPIMRSLFEFGVFNRDMAQMLLSLAALEKLVGAGLSKLSQPDRHRRDMAASIILRDLPFGLASLLLDSSTYIDSLIRPLIKAHNDGEFKSEKSDPLRPLHLQLSHSDFADLVENLRDASFCSTHRTNAGLSRLLADVECHAVALKPGRNALTIIYSQFVEGFARQEWSNLLNALKSHAQSMEVPFDQRLFAADLVGRDIGMPRGVSLESVALIRALITASHTKLDATDFIVRVDKKLSKVRDLHVQISSLGQNLTASAMGKIAELAGIARTEILSNRGWFQAELDSYVPLIRTWQSFYDDWDSQSRKGGSPPTSKARKALALVEHLPAPETAPAKLVTPELTDIHEQLDTALTHCVHLEHELSQARTEIFNHRTFRDALAASDAPSERLAVDMELLRRVATREALTPTDVLAFIQFVAGDRVVVLESAWKSARDAAAFPYSARMLDVLNTMVFPYYESLKGGNPDAVARDLLGGAYSAKESHSVGVSPKLRVQREFVFDGQTRFFERHLKIGNGTGVDGMRVHFDIINCEKIVIAYAGPHLDCTTTS